VTELGSFVDGKWRHGGGGGCGVFDPATEEQIEELPLLDGDEVDQALAAADAAFPVWRSTSAMRRGEILRTAAALVRERSETIAVAIARELGKPLREARVEVGTACEHIEWAAEEGRRAYGRVIPARDPAVQVSTRIEPLGPIAGFAPWNAPLITPARKIAYALAAGCSIVLKAAEETPTAAVELVRAFEDAGTPPGVLNLVFGSPAEVGARLMGSALTMGATFTGSTAVGKQLLALAAPTVTVTVMELGGYAPVFVFPDADVDAVADSAVAASMRNSGQVCTSPTRFFVHADLHDRFVTRFAERADALRLGDPLDDATDMGPVATPRRLAEMAELTEDARPHVAAGGRREDRPGWFWRPTLLAGVSDDVRAARVEPFGPMALTTPWTDLGTALGSANRLGFGLAAYVWSTDLTAVGRVIDGLDVGAVAVNGWQVSLAETPFGGVGESGIGYEGGEEGLRAFQRVKSVISRSAP
jgi:succinate-semialdehyde dehydrogenase/glutarate-semialdehyde dehydrogenase